MIAINELLENAPETINDSPYDDGWFFKLKMSDPDELEDLLDADSYQDLASD